MNWTTTKPDFKEECIVVTADIFHGEWEYQVWEIKWIDSPDGKYLGWCNNLGEEQDDLAELAADKYLILPKHE